jgi:hypothetical protein
MNIYEEIKIQIYIHLILALDGGEVVSTVPQQLYPWGKSP